MFTFKKKHTGWAWWLHLYSQLLRRLRQDDHKFETSLGYTVNNCLTKNSNKPK
jgi:hypothetical protein